jgi:hypothetical protein
MQSQKYRLQQANATREVVSAKSAIHLTTIGGIRSILKNEEVETKAALWWCCFYDEYVHQLVLCTQKTYFNEAPIDLMQKLVFSFPKLYHFCNYYLNKLVKQHKSNK